MVYSIIQFGISTGTVTATEINRTATGAANLVPIAYGSISSTGVINSGTGNFTVTNPTAGAYAINITGEGYTNSGYITNLTVVSGTTVRLCTTGQGGGNLQVSIFDLSGTLVNAAFHFTVYKQ